ncbi:hypothetical protein [Acidithiobacillus concretivorus]|uniref:Uncharacterized protein n=1 Tax=Acidithiobacillus concretivorus TaxID=3063952 RepID=A0ABS5ZQC5_9PROT|nr:hypothetical protein [Acidithiobacillus concretivorus]MBU2738717.1 hypothetical protein [Acidithiobacillus concretivorus]
MKILVSLSGGLLQAVYVDDEADRTGVEIVVADYDIEGSDMQPVKDPDGEPVLMWREIAIADSPFAEKMFETEEQMTDDFPIEAEVVEQALEPIKDPDL